MVTATGTFNAVSVEVVGIEEIEALTGALAARTAVLSPAAVPPGDAFRLWAAFGRVARLAEAAQVLLAGRVEEAEEWRATGHRDAASHMAAVAGRSVTSARKDLATSRHLAARHRTAAALRAGSVSPGQAAPIADAAAVNPSAEAGLLRLARSGVSLVELGEACRRAKAAGDPDPASTHARIHRERRLRHHVDAEGAWCLSGRGTVEAGTEVAAALEEIIDELFTNARNDGGPVSREQLAFDALQTMARRSLSTEWDDSIDIDSGRSTGEATPGEPVPDATPAGAEPNEAPPTGRRRRRPRRRRSRQVQYLGILRVDVEALRRGRPEGDELCEIAGAGPIPVDRARALLGEAVVKLVITRGVDVVSVTHLGRAPTVAQRVALLWQTPGCSVAGCPRTWVEFDHRRDWAVTRHTRLDELDTLCRHDHRLKTLHGWALVPGKGKRPLVPPSDPRHPRHQLQPTS